MFIQYHFNLFIIFSVIIEIQVVHAWSHTSILQTCIFYQAILCSSCKQHCLLSNLTLPHSSDRYHAHLQGCRSIVSTTLSCPSQQYRKEKSREPPQLTQKSISFEIFHSFIHPFLNITRMKDSEKTHLKYSSSTKSCNNMKKIKRRCSELCTLHYIFSVFTFAHMQVSFEAVILLECSYPTNHSTARAKITIYSCMQHLLVWIMSIRNQRPHLGKGSAILFDGRKQLPNLIFVACNVYKERLEHLTGTSFRCLQNQYKCIFFQEVQQHQIIH